MQPQHQRAPNSPTLTTATTNESLSMVGCSGKCRTRARHAVSTDELEIYVHQPASPCAASTAPQPANRGLDVPPWTHCSSHSWLFMSNVTVSVCYRMVADAGERGGHNHSTTPVGGSPKRRPAGRTRHHDGHGRPHERAVAGARGHPDKVCIPPPQALLFIVPMAHDCPSTRCCADDASA